MLSGRFFKAMVFGLAGMASIGPNVLTAADAPSAKLALSFRPTQSTVEYEQPTAAEVEKCEVKVERTGKASGWVVVGEAGQVLRRFVDTNADNVVDQWRYYQNGLEVYRDIDSNYNNKVDQCRWLNTGGTRWGLDTNEDGRIDTWKMISAAEVSREAIVALANRDQAALQTLLITAEDIRQLGIDNDLRDKLLEAVKSPGTAMGQVLANSRILNARTTWMRFDSAPPGIIPADEGKARNDLWVYQNALSIVESNGQTGLVQLGELVRVGETWKLTQIPRPLEGDNLQVAAGILMQPALTTSPAAQAAASVSPEAQELLQKLQKLDESAPNPAAGGRAIARYNDDRARILSDLVRVSNSEDEKAQWIRQMADGIAASVQTGAFPAGLTRLRSLQSQMEQQKAAPELVAYVRYRTMLSQYTVDLQNADNASRPKVQAKWLEDLEAFTRQYPKADDRPEALLQLAIAQEFAGKTDEAKKWYQQLSREHSDTNAGARGAGAIHRLNLEGEPFRFSGSGLNGRTIDASSYRGKVVAVLFWSTWCKPCTEELPRLRALYQKYQRNGFEILGVNLDATSQPVAPFLQQHGVNWPQIHEPGGLEASGPSKQFGIISLPTMILVGKDGRVVARSISVENLTEQLPDLLKR